MFGAGKLESGNIPEYERAAQLARACGKHEFVDCLLSMAGNGMGPRKVFSFDGPEPSLGLSIANMARTTAEREHSVAF